MIPEKPVDFLRIVQAFLAVFGGYAQLFDFYADILVLWVVYQHSLDTTVPEQQDDYQIALTVCFLALTATFMAQ